MVKHEYVTTAFDLPGFRIRRNLGVVRGIVVRSRSIVGTIGAGCRLLSGATFRCSATFVNRRAATPSS